MLRLLPADSCAALQRLFPWVIHADQNASFDPRRMQAAVELIERIPAELIVLDSAEAAEFSLSLSFLRRGAALENRAGPHMSGEERQAVRDLHRLLAKCPDRHPSPTASDPEFIGDVDLRFDIRSDITALLL